MRRILSLLALLAVLAGTLATPAFASGHCCGGRRGSGATTTTYAACPVYDVCTAEYCDIAGLHTHDDETYCHGKNDRYDQCGTSRRGAYCGGYYAGSSRR